MSSINPLAREVNVKVVYYGPGLSGKTTSLQRIYAQLKPDSRGELISLATEGDRTLFFDFLPVYLERVNDLSVRLQVYTVPGQVFYDSTRKLVLNGADGVVFVADSQRAALDANVESIDNLRENLSELGIDLESFPLVIQYNKRDLPNALPVPQLHAALHRSQAKEFESVADKGQGVYPPFKELVRQILVELRARQLRAQQRHDSDSQLPEITLTGMKIPKSLLASQPASPGVEPGGISYRKLVPGVATSVGEVERLVGGGKFGAAVHLAAERLADLLGTLPSTDPTPAAKAALLGLDGREYLKLCRLAGQPDVALDEVDALFSLHVLVGAALKAEDL